MLFTQMVGKEYNDNYQYLARFFDSLEDHKSTLEPTL